MSNITVPVFDNDYFVIVDSESKELAAVIFSYVGSKSKYVPLFEFPITTIENTEYNEDNLDEHAISRRRSREFNIKVKNALHRAGGCKYLILGNLNQDQRSFLSFLDDYNLIEINNVSEVDSFLSPIVSKNKILNCREDELLNALYYAVSNDFILKIDNSSPKFVEVNFATEGLVVIEDVDRVSTVVAVNYALSVNSQIKVIPPLKVNHIDIRNFIKEWKNGDDNAYNNLSAELYNGIQDLDFNLYEYATFFTVGGPYSLILNNIIPITHVHLRFSPDFFVFNNIFFENAQNVNSALVFSPKEFSDEETNYVINKLEEGNFYVKDLVGDNATLYNIDHHVKQYPFDVLHFCSHGGEIDGHSIIEEFTDRNGVKHVIEYDEVLAFAIQKGAKTVGVHSKNIWRKFDGLIWGSREFKEKMIPNYIISDMSNEMDRRIDKNRTYKKVIENSCMIKCWDSVYQAMFNIMAIHHCPIIFNNTCWSWSDIADSFLSVGVRGYLGTLWDINNGIAKKSAELFYDKIFSENVLQALQSSFLPTIGKRDENIYIYWGLPFTTLRPAASIAKSKKNVAEELLDSVWDWEDRLQQIKKKSTKEIMEALVEWGINEIETNFRKEAIEIISEMKDNQQG